MDGVDDTDPPFIILPTPSYIVPTGEAFVCPCGGFQIGPFHSAWFTSVEAQCPGCGAVIVLDGGP